MYVLESQNVIIGGSTPADRNVISGNWRLDIHGDIYGAGIYLDYSVSTIIAGNYIGTDAAGIAAIANDYGIYTNHVTGATIGGSAAGAGNVISGNLDNGIDMEWGISDNVIEGNYIGTNTAGGALGNANGIWANLTIGLTIGGTTGNVISDNTGAGVKICDDPDTYCSRVSILGNSIFANGGLGIDLVSSGDAQSGPLKNVTLNDTGDVDSGPNYLQNFPVLAAATAGPSRFTVVGLYNSTASTSVRIELFANTAADSSTYGEGQTYLGYVDVTTGSDGNITAVNDSSGTATMTTGADGVNRFVVSFNTSRPAGEYISATATNLVTSATSEFSQSVAADTPGISVMPATSPANPLTVAEGEQATFNVVLTGAPSANVTIDLSSTDTTEGTLSTTSLVFTPTNWNTPQTVTVNGVNDNLVNGDQAYTIVTALAISSDANYGNTDAADVSMKTIDNGYNTIWVTNNSDVVNGTVTSIAALYDNPAPTASRSAKPFWRQTSRTTAPAGRIGFASTFPGAECTRLPQLPRWIILRDR